MRQKINELLDRPWTTRGYLKLTVIVYVLCAILLGLLYLKFYWDGIKGWFNKKFSKKDTKKED